MNTQTPDNSELIVKMVVSAWESQLSRLSKLIGSLSDEQLLSETAPGRNRGSYLLGHLVAVSDGMRPLLELGPKKYPELEDVYLKNPDKSGLPTPSMGELRSYWDEVHGALTKHFNQMQPEAWFARHTAVSEADFAKEPHRNKLNLLINRTTHMGYHFGQLAYLNKK